MRKQCPKCGEFLNEKDIHPYNSCGKAPLDLRHKGKEVVGDCPFHGPYYARHGEVVDKCPNCAKGRPPFK